MLPLSFVLSYFISVSLFSVFEYYRYCRGRKLSHKIDGSLSKCPNYRVCAGMFPDTVREELCSQCDVRFGKSKGGAGKLVFPSENIYCPICLEDKPGVTQAFCSHSLCIECFQKHYFAVENLCVLPDAFIYAGEATVAFVARDGGYTHYAMSIHEIYTDLDAPVSVVRCPLCRRG